MLSNSVQAAFFIGLKQLITKNNGLLR